MMYSLLTNTTRFSLQLNKTGPSRGIVVLLPFYHTSPQIRWRWLKGDLSFIVLLLFCTASYAPHKCNSFTSPPLCIRYYASLQFREEDQRMTDYLKQVTCCPSQSIYLLFENRIIRVIPLLALERIYSFQRYHELLLLLMMIINSSWMIFIILLCFRTTCLLLPPP